MIEQTYFPPGKEKLLADAYRELLKLLEEHPKLKADLFFEGRTSLWLSENSSDIIDVVKEGIIEKRYEIGTYTYTHPVLSLIPYEDTYKQIVKGLNIDEEVWNFRPRGLLLSEGGYDPSLVKILKDLGIEWLLISAKTYERDFPESSKKDLHTPFILKGVFDSAVTALCITDFGLRTHLPTSWVEISPGNFVESIISDKEEDLIYALKQDAEFIYYASANLSGKKYGEDVDSSSIVESLHTLFREIENKPQIHPILISEYLREHTPQRTLCLRPSLGGWGTLGRESFDEWLKGSEKVGYLIDESRNELKIVEYIIILAEKIGLNTSNSRKILMEAWDRLMKAETSIGRRAVAHPRGQPLRVIHSMEWAIEAKNLARKAVEEINSR
jgi:alpha-amylase/alpha-mannosidase (GH57 family)